MLWTEFTAKFLSLAKVELREQPDKYDALVNILAEYRRSAEEVQKEAEELLSGRPLLIMAFNVLLPPELRITEPEKENCKKLALGFVRWVKVCTQHQEGMYQTFIDLLQMYRSRQKTRLEVKREVLALFKNHPSLQCDFLRFFTPMEATDDFIGLAEVELRDQPDKYAALLDILIMDGRDALDVLDEVAQLLHGKPLLVSRFNALDVLMSPLDVIEMPDLNLFEAFFHNVGERFQDDGSLLQYIAGLMQELRRRTKTFVQVSREVMDLLANHQDLQLEFLGIFPPLIRSDILASLFP